MNYLAQPYVGDWIEDYYLRRHSHLHTVSSGLRVMVLSGTEVTSTSAPNKTMTLNPELNNCKCDEELCVVLIE